jgi:hypothetical protein
VLYDGDDHHVVVVVAVVVAVAVAVVVPSNIITSHIWQMRWMCSFCRMKFDL